VTLDLARPLAALFVMALGALTICLLAFLREVFLAAVGRPGPFRRLAWLGAWRLLPRLP